MATPLFKKREIKKTYEIGLFCDTCMGQPLVPGDKILPTYPPIYTFVCPSCKKEFSMTEQDVPQELNEYGEWEVVETSKIIL